MKNLFAFVIVAGMVTLASCGGAAEAAKKMQDSINLADSLAKVAAARVADSTKMADSINGAAMKAAADAKAKAMADSLHQDSITKKLIKVKK